MRDERYSLSVGIRVGILNVVRNYAGLVNWSWLNLKSSIYRSSGNNWWALRNISVVLPGISSEKVTAGLTENVVLITSVKGERGNIFKDGV